MLNKDHAGFHAQSWSEAIHQLTQRSTDHVLATILGTAGSTPRNSGSKMVVTADDIYDTVGGGHLEFQIIQRARELLLETGDDQQMAHFPLGAKLGQCCGGSVSVLFERFVCQRPVVQIHGAGHVGLALIHILGQLPMTVQWVDSRADLFPDTLPANVERVVETYPEDAVKDAPAKTLFIILTHNHQLDFSLTETILKRGDASLLGVIGSDTKADRFRMRLQHKGFTEEQIQQMQCPVGLAQVGGKLPMEVAVSIAGQIIATCQSQSETRPQRRGVQWKTLKHELSVSEDARHEHDAV